MFHPECSDNCPHQHNWLDNRNTDLSLHTNSELKPQAMIFTPRCSGIEVISTKQNNLMKSWQKKKGDNFIEKYQTFCKINRNNLINDV